ncbi:hypothetical protein KAH55_01850, partial [bacterium]|nr:hypothetical protein [bacterium]
MKRIFMLLMLLVGFTTLMGSDGPAFNNAWKIIPTMSPQMNRYTQNMGLEIVVDNNQVTLIYQFGRRRGRLDTLQLTVNEKPNQIPLKRSSRMTTYYSGIHAVSGEMNSITASWADDGRTLVLDQEFPAEVAQGTKMLREKHTLTVSKNQDFLTYTIKRESRIDEGKYVFKVKDSLHANVMCLDDNWEVKGDLQRQAMLICLQGIVNRDGANLYLIYPETWQFTYSQRLYEWYRDDRGYTFSTLKTPAEALAAYKNQVKGYVVWDKNVRTSLTVAYTVAGLEDVVVVSEDQIPMLDSLGFKKVADFRGKFTGMNDTEIYAWAKDQYWDQCSRKFLIWLGGHAGKVMKPGVADWG